MGRFIRPAMALVLALSLRQAPASDPVEPPGEDRWYLPVAADFRPHYDRDPDNRRKQSWDQYWGWVQSFYDGNFFARGWGDRARWLVEDIRSEAQRSRLRGRLNALGREICAEWAKDYDVRKVGSAELLAWGKMLEKARSDDDGTGAAIHRTIEAIREEHRRKVGGGPPR